MGRKTTYLVASERVPLPGRFEQRTYVPMDMRVVHGTYVRFHCVASSQPYGFSRRHDKALRNKSPYLADGQVMFGTRRKRVSARRDVAKAAAHDQAIFGTRRVHVSEANRSAWAIERFWMVVAGFGGF